MVTTSPPKTIVKPTALGPVANTDTKLLIYGLFQRDLQRLLDAARKSLRSNDLSRNDPIAQRPHLVVQRTRPTTTCRGPGGSRQVTFVSPISKGPSFGHRTGSMLAKPVTSSSPSGTPLAPAVVRSLEEAGDQLLTCYEFPRAMWKSIRTTNALENLNREFRRRTKNPSVVLQRGVRGRFCCLGLSPLARFNYDASMATNV